MVVHYAVNVPYGDQWELVPLIQKLRQGNLGFAELFAPHNEHRIFFPRLIMLLLASLTRWNTVVEMVVSIALALGNFGVMALMLRHTLRPGRIRLAAMVFTSLIIFSPNQAENWLWGWQISWFLNVLGVLTAVWALGVWRAPATRRLLVAAVGALVATFSLASGILVWFACLPLVWADRELRSRTPFWVLLTLLGLATYFSGYHDPNLSAKAATLQAPLLMLAFFLAYAGSPIGFSVTTAIVLGAAWICVAIGLILMTRFVKPAASTLLPWSALLLYGVLAGSSITISRLASGLTLAFASRYVTISLLMLLPASVALFKIVEVGDLRKFASRAAAVALLVLTLLVGLNWVRGTRYMIGLHTFLVQAQTCARDSQNSEAPCLRALYPDTTVLWPRLNYLRSIHWGGQ
jgi:hypothetical protein